YTGDFVDGEKSGIGTETYADGRPAKKGQWNNGRFIPKKP
ncbi:MAG: hypothetical protein ACKO6R_05735, partial [Burkholderiaceae bacterium]